MPSRTPKTNASISFGLYDTSAREDASYSGEAQSFTNFDVFNKVPGIEEPKVATLERNFFLLDGSFELFPDDASELELFYWSKIMSGSDGVFDDPPMLTINFTENHSSAGLTLYFYEPTNDYVNSMRIQWYDHAGQLISAKDFYPDSTSWFAENIVEDYRRISIIFRSTNNPYRYVKIGNIDFGVERVFDQEHIVTAKLLEESNALSMEISSNKLDATIYSDDDEFSLLNPKGLFPLLQQRQQLNVFETVGGEPIWLGTFYLDTWKDAQDNQLTMSAIDLLGIISQTQFKGGMYTGESSASVIAEIMDSADAEYELDELLSDIPIYGHIPICSHRDALQQVAFAIGAAVDCARSDKIQIYVPTGNSSGFIPVSRKFIGGKVQLGELITRVAVTAHSYVKSEDEAEALNEELPAGEYEITFSNPLHRLWVQGAVITESNVNYANIVVTQPGEVILTGMEYTHNTKIISKTTTPLPANTVMNERQVENATLIGVHNAREIANRVYDYFQHRYSTEFSMLLGQEETGRIYIVDSLRGEKLRGRVERMSIDLAGGFLSNMKIVGERIETTHFDYTGEIYTGEEVGVI